MKRRTQLAIALAAVLAALALWWHHHAAAPGTAASSTARSIALATAGLPAHARRPDPRTVSRAQVAGTITDDAHAPIAHARVCIDLASGELPDALSRDPRCTFSDDRGAYAIADLYAGEVMVAAMAKGFVPAAFHPDGDRRRTSFELHAGEHRSGVDLVLARGGVEITGTVSDITGGPVAHALVRARSEWWGDSFELPAIESDDSGKFTMWVRAGTITVSAVADGYTRGEDSGRAPGKFDILLTPESSLSGTVVDARTGAPMPGVHVEVTGDESPWSDSTADITDDQGHFHVDRLEPGRYAAIARSPRGYGHSDGSTRVGLAQHVDGVIVKLYPAVRVEGRIVLPDDKHTTCRDGWARLHLADPERYVVLTRDPDGTLHADGVLPGTYHVRVSCDGYHARDKYPPLEVKDQDLTGLEWQVDPGAVIRGHVVTKSGEPVEAAIVSASTVGGAAREQTGWGGDQSARDGAYELTGLKPGSYRVDVYSERGQAPKDGWKIAVPSISSVIDQELVLEDGGAIRGVVADADGKPVAGVHVLAVPVAGTGGWGPGASNVRTGDDGSFALEDLRPGDYRVIASKSQWGWGSGKLRKPGTTDDAKQGERATVRAGETATVRLVVESTSGTIHGTVVDADGKPVTDAYVSAARESDAAGAQRSNLQMMRWNADARPVLTGTDGSFAITQLQAGNYTVLAQRKGGGEAIAEHVPAGGTARLELKRTGSIEGRAHRDGGPPDQLDVSLRDATTGYTRQERFFRSGGHYELHDLPAGHFAITYSAEGSEKQQVVDLGDGEHKQGVDVELDPLVTITGRVVELGTQTPASGIMMLASAGKTQSFDFSFGDDDDQQNITDDSGRFTIARAPRGMVTLTGFPKDWQASEYGFLRALRDAEGPGTVDVGDLGVVHRRVKPGDPVGELGVHFAQATPGAAVDAYVWQVTWIDPAGPAAKTDLKVGDVVTTIDGVDVAGANAANGWMLLRAPPGTTIHLGLARGTTVAVTLAPPS